MPLLPPVLSILVTEWEVRRGLGGEVMLSRTGGNEERRCEGDGCGWRRRVDGDVPLALVGGAARVDPVTALGGERLWVAEGPEGVTAMSGPFLPSVSKVLPSRCVAIVVSAIPVSALSPPWPVRLG